MLAHPRSAMVGGNRMAPNLAEALKSLPHGPEFRFVDRLLALEPGEHGRAEYTLRGDEPFLAGHFPNDPLLPGVLLIESAAQLSGIIAQSDPRTPPLKALRLTALRQVKILGAARPGERIELESRVTGRMGHLVQATASAWLEGRQILQAEITLSGAAESE
ncbi:MAG TPA: 3-hydroxyacyl-ACP dehydratase FabZ family protein [Methylomirabilota bacterium]|nr:3-hydroxyacyl-ACP dehydratase FabZ family protein [Methylomirabilota bacterium]